MCSTSSRPRAGPATFAGAGSEDWRRRIDVIRAPARTFAWSGPILGTDRLFFIQAEDGIRDATVTAVQTCALPISPLSGTDGRRSRGRVGVGARHGDRGA